MKPAEKKKLILFSIAAVLIILLDQLMKIFVVKEVIPISYSTNTGAGFGLFQDSVKILIWISVFVVGLIVYYYDKIPVKEKLIQAAVGLILGGTIGNLIDRIRLGYVIDFIDLRIWPSFNIADSAITVGVIGLIIYLVKKK